MIEKTTLRVVAQRRMHEEIEIASLTKIMTCFTAIMVCEKFQVPLKSTNTRVSDKAVEMLGTSAELQPGDIVSLFDLLHGMMLPSGDDASVAVAEAIGKIIQRNKKKNCNKSHFDVFIAHMNLLSKEMGLDQVFQNSSGLSANPNYSTAKSIAIVAVVALQHPLFCDIVSCK